MAAHTTTIILLGLRLAGLAKQEPLSQHPSHQHLSREPLVFCLGQEELAEALPGGRGDPGTAMRLCMVE